MRRWSALPFEELISRLSTADVYEVEHGAKNIKSK